MLDVGQGYKNTIAKAKRISGGGDAAGRRVSRNADSFSYNARSEVIGAVIGTNDYGYAYDAIGNRIATTEDTKTTEYLANELNQYTQISVPSVSSVVNPTYDADGNMTRLGDWRHTWDAENRLVRSEPYGFATNGAVRLEYVYNHKNLRVAKIKERLTGRGASYPFDPSQPGTWDAIETRRYVWDGHNIAAEIVIDEVAPSTNIAYYVWGTDLSGTLQGAGGVGGLLAVVRNGTPYFPCYDANGNVTDYVDAYGNIRAHYEYSPFGETIAQSGDMADTFKFRFSTKYWDEETRSYYYGYRHYAPKLGCWLSKDPIGVRGGRNLYGFTRNNPVNRVDRLGLMAVIPVADSPRDKAMDNGSLEWLWASVFLFFSDEESALLSANGGGYIVHEKHTEIHVQKCTGEAIADESQTIQKRIPINADGTTKAYAKTTDHRTAPVYANVASMRGYGECVKGTIIIKSGWYLIIGGTLPPNGSPTEDNLSGSLDGDPQHGGVGANEGWPSVSPDSYTSFGSLSIKVRMSCPNSYSVHASGRNILHGLLINRVNRHGEQRDREGTGYAW